MMTLICEMCGHDHMPGDPCTVGGCTCPSGSGDVGEEDAELLEFAIGPLTEMAERGHYWADEVDDDERVTPEDVIAAITRILARLRRTPEGVTADRWGKTSTIVWVKEDDPPQFGSPGSGRYDIARREGWTEHLLVPLATQDPNAGGEDE